MKRVYGSHEIEEAIRPYLRKKDWALLDCRIYPFDIYRTLYGSKEGEKVAQMLEQMIIKVIDEIGSPEDVLGSESVDRFVVITSEEAAPKIKETLKARFNSEVLVHYSILDRERGYMVSIDNEKVELMHMSVGIFSSSGHQRRHLGDILSK